MGDGVRELETEYRAVVEEILELRGDDGRIAAFVRSISEPGALADTSGYSPDLTFEQKVQLLETVDVPARLELALGFQRERLTLMQIRRRIRDDVNTGMEKQQREYVLRKQLESIRKELGEDETSVVEEFRTKIAESAMPDHVREQAERELGALRAHGRELARGADHPQLPGLAPRRTVGCPLRGAARPQGDARGARRRPRRSRGRQGPYRRVHRSAQAPRRAGHRGGQEVRRDPDPDRPARHRQDVDRRVDRPVAESRVRPDVARRHPRRGGDPGPPAHLHRRAPRPARAGAPRREDDEPRDPARRGRQGRRRLARGSVCGAARGARSGAELDVPRPLSRRRARPLGGHLPRDREPGGHDPGAAARPDGGHPLRRVHDGREGRDRDAATCGRGSASATASARTRSQSRTTCSRR